MVESKRSQIKIDYICVTPTYTRVITADCLLPSIDAGVLFCLFPPPKYLLYSMTIMSRCDLHNDLLIIVRKVLDWLNGRSDSADQVVSSSFLLLDNWC